MGLVRSKPTPGNPHHSHARRRRPSIHCDDGATEGCRLGQVMELDSWLGFRGKGLVGGSVARPCGASSARSPCCSRRCVVRVGWCSTGSVPTVWSELYRGRLYGCPRHLCVMHTTGYLNLATAAGATAIHGHGGTVVVTVTKGAGDVCAHCQ